MKGWFEFHRFGSAFCVEKEKSFVEIIKSQKVRDFIEEHALDDPAVLALQVRKHSHIPIPLVVAQIKARRKAKTKLPTFFQNSEVIYPPGVSLEQSSSEQAAKYKGSIVSGNILTDLTGGFGIDIYYMSESFASSRHVEQNEELVEVVESNIEVLEKKNITFYRSNAKDFLDNEKEPADLYYIDPARRNDSDQKIFQIDECSPNLKEILPAVLKRGAKVLIKLAPLLDIQQALRVLPFVCEVHIVSVKNECKELLFKIDSGQEDILKIVAVNLLPSGVSRFEIDPSAEQKILPQFSMPELYLYEPNASIMKAGGFNSIAIRFGLNKLHRNSHLYTSQTEVTNFPGRVFKIEAITVVNKKKLKPFLSDGKANITVRNYPDSVKEIRNKTRIRDGGDVYLFATTLMDGSPKVLVCSKV